MTDRLPDKLESNARVEVRVAGVVVGTRRIIDFVSSGGNADDGGIDDKVTVDMSAFGGGGSDLWESVAGDLHPVANPDSLTASTVTGDITLTAADGLYLKSTGSTYLEATDKVVITSHHTGAGTAVEIQADGANARISLDCTGNVTMASSGAQAFIQAQTNITAQAATGFVEIDAGSHASLTAVTQLDLAGSQVDIKAPSSAVTDALIAANFISFYLDEAGNKLKVRVRYSGGGYKTGEIALI